MPLEFRFESKKAIAAVVLLVREGVPELTKGKTAKLLFLADKRHLVQYGRPITGDWYAALPHGPVPSATVNMLDLLENGYLADPDVASLAGQVGIDRRFQYPRLMLGQVTAGPENFLSKTEVASIKTIAAEYGAKSFTELRAITHEMPAYERAWQNRGTSQRGTMEFEDFFEEDENAVACIKQEMMENARLRRAFPEPVWE